jgi:hypothetical protein
MILENIEYAESIPNEFVIGRRYHCRWALKKGMCWKLVSIEGDMATLRTPSTRKIIKTKLSELYDTNHTIFKKRQKPTP